MARGGRGARLVAAGVLVSGSLGVGAALAPGGVAATGRAPNPASAIATYAGRYQTGPEPHGSQLIRGSLLIAIGLKGYTEGGITIYTRTKRGIVQDIKMLLIDFRAASGSVTAAMALGNTGPVLGHVTGHHIGRTRNLEVAIRPTSYAGTSAILFRYQGRYAGPPPVPPHKHT